MKQLANAILDSVRRSPRWRWLLGRIVATGEWLVFGGTWRERILSGLLGAHHRSQFRRRWRFHAHEQPHFYNQRWNAHEFAYGRNRNAYVFFRGFLVADLLRPGDRLLDIGCGDGFFSRSFYATRCAHIDAIDIEPSAIATARRQNAGPTIHYRLTDAVREPFPAPRYDVVVWDGAIGHFARDDLAAVLTKVAAVVGADGIFAGSESLGVEGADHLQFFEDEAALAAVFRPYFRHIWLRTQEYPISGGLLRREAYWRCTNGTGDRHAAGQWIDFSAR